MADSRPSSLRVLLEGIRTSVESRATDVSKGLDLGLSHVALTMSRPELVPTYWVWTVLLVMAHGCESCLRWCIVCHILGS